jgi:hypothetical protein
VLCTRTTQRLRTCSRPEPVSERYVVYVSNPTHDTIPRIRSPFHIYPFSNDVVHASLSFINNQLAFRQGSDPMLLPEPYDTAFYLRFLSLRTLPTAIYYAILRSLSLPSFNASFLTSRITLNY